MSARRILSLRILDLHGHFSFRTFFALMLQRKPLGSSFDERGVLEGLCSILSGAARPRARPSVYHQQEDG